MKKLFLILVMTAIAATTMAQSQLSTIRGKDKNGKTIKVEYYQGSVEDYIESVKYQVVDDLQSQVTKKESEIKTLNGQVTKKESEIKTLNGQVKDLQGKVNKKDTEIANLNQRIKDLEGKADSGSKNDAQINSLNDQIKDLQNQLAEKKTEVQNLNGSINTLNQQIRELQNGSNDVNSTIQKLEKEKQELLATIEDLQKNNGNNSALIDTIAKRNGTIKNLEYEIKKKDVMLTSTNNKLNKQIEECDRKMDSIIEKCASGAVKSVPTPAISLSAGIGPVFVSNAKLGEVWSKDVATAKYFNLSYATARLSDALPLSIEAGIGIESYKMGAHINACQVKIERQVDMDGDAYTAIYDLGNINETASLTYLDIPISICIGQPEKNRVSAYFKLGLTPSINLGKKFEGEGTYSLKGYYPQWDVTLDDVEPLGFGSNKNFYEDAEINPAKFILIGHAAFGTYVPLSKQLLLKAGLKCEYTFMQVAPELNGELPFALGQCNVLAGAKIFVPSLEIGLVYTLK